MNTLQTPETYPTQRLALRAAFKKCDELNPPLFPVQPIPYGVKQTGRRFEVVHLPTKKVAAVFEALA